VEGGAFGWDEMVPNLEPTDTLPDHGEAWRLPWEVLGGGAMRCRGQIIPWQLERRIELSQTVHVAYVYTNIGQRQHHAYWCAHPLFVYEPGMRVSVRLPQLMEGGSTKMYYPPGSMDYVELGRIRMRWDPVVTPDVAVWICNGDLGGYRQIAVEPATASPILEPGGSLSWWLEISPL
jgi:hypothetical protein